MSSISDKKPEEKCEVYEKVCTTDCQLPFDNHNGTWDQCNSSEVCLLQVNTSDNNQAVKSWYICLVNLTSTISTSSTTELYSNSTLETTSNSDISFKFRG